VIYLDQAASSFPKPEPVVRAVTDCLSQVAANPGRSAHRLSLQAARLIFEARESLARLFGVSESRRIVFASGATEALNLALLGLLRPGNHVVVSSMEHNAVMRPLRYLQESRQVQVTEVQADLSGNIDPSTIRAALRKSTKLVVVQQASNVVGALRPLAAIKEAIGEVWLLVDAAQSAGAVPIQFDQDGIDLLAFCGHKAMLGPQGTGGLILRDGIAPDPLVRGGTGSRSESDEQPDFWPDRYESGTPNTPGIAGLGAAAEFILEQSIETIAQKLKGHARQISEGLRTIPRVRVVGLSLSDLALPTVSFVVEGMAPSEVGRLLDQRHQVLVRAGLHCAPAAHRTLGTFPQGTVRFSAGFFNSSSEIEEALAALRDVITRPS
jgi:cysteine desulfurase / selenocysteine lyase